MNSNMGIGSISFRDRREINIYEVGVGNAYLCKTYPLWPKRDWHFTLIEPNPFIYLDLALCTRQHPNTTALAVACWETEGFHDLILASDRSFLADTYSPMQGIYHGRAQTLFGAFKVPVYCVRFSRVDDGKIDILYLGVEGSEWSVIRYMRSRPALIVLNYYAANDYGYQLIQWDKIMKWMDVNGYRMLQANENEMSFVNGARAVSTDNGRVELK